LHQNCWWALVLVQAARRLLHALPQTLSFNKANKA
jgi:hypothetical protein